MSLHLLRSTNGRLALLAFVLGSLAAVAGDPGVVRVPEISALELAERIRGRDENLAVIDLRPAPAFAEFAVPTAQNVGVDTIDALSFAPDDVIVLYGETTRAATVAAQRLRRLGVANVHALRGGAVAWLDEVMSPALPSDMPAAERARIAEVSRSFGGQPRMLDANAPGADSKAAAGPPRSMRRRGCAI